MAKLREPPVDVRVKIELTTKVSQARETEVGIAMRRIALSALLITSLLAPVSGSISFAETGTWQQLQNVPDFNPNHEILLTNGCVLFGDNGEQQSGSSGWYELCPDIHGSYIKGSWNKAASMPDNYAPENAASGLLPDGRVIVEGGDMNGSSTYVGENLGAIYDPVANTWSMVAPPNNGQGEFSSISDAPSVVLPDGTFMFGPSGSGSAGDTKQQEVALLNESTMTWKVDEPIGRVGMNPESGFNLLPNGNVLTIPTNIPDLKISEIFNPVSGTWSSQPLPTSLVDPLTAGPNGNNAEMGPATLMPNGKLFAEGSNGKTAIYDTQTGKWSAGPSMPEVNGKIDTAIDAPSAILPDGKVLMELSPIDPTTFASSAPAHFFIFDGASISQISDPPAGDVLNLVGSNSARMLVLPNGQVLFNPRMGASNLFVYTDSNSGNPDWAPKVSNVPNSIMVGRTYSIEGEQLSGLTSGSDFGDDWNPNTNYPLVQLVNAQNHDVFYARTFSIGSYSVAPGNNSSVQFQLPADIINGSYSLRVIASGFASAPVPVLVASGTATSTTPVTTSTPATSSKTAGSGSSNKLAIICTKGLLTIHVPGISPRCPIGYKLRK